MNYQQKQRQEEVGGCTRFKVCPRSKQWAAKADTLAKCHRGICCIVSTSRATYRSVIWPWSDLKFPCLISTKHNRKDPLRTDPNTKEPTTFSASFAYTTPEGSFLAAPCTYMPVLLACLQLLERPIFHFLCNLLQCCSQRPNKCPLHERTCRDKKIRYGFHIYWCQILFCFVIALCNIISL